jgi:hypothetical protein
MEAKKSFDKESDYFNPGPGTLTISFLGHGSLAMSWTILWSTWTR